MGHHLLVKHVQNFPPKLRLHGSVVSNHEQPWVITTSMLPGESSLEEICRALATGAVSRPNGRTWHL